MSLKAAFDSKAYDLRKEEYYREILRHLNEQKKMFADYKAAVESAKKFDLDEEDTYQRRRELYNKQGKENKNYKGEAYDGDSFTLGTIFMTNVTFDKPKPKKVDKNDYVSAEKLIDRETWVISNLGRLFVDVKDEASEVFYRDLPKFLTQDASNILYGVKEKFPTAINDWRGQIMEFGAASVAIKMTDPSYIDAQITLVKQMQKSKDPLNPQAAFQRFINKMLPF